MVIYSKEYKERLKKEISLLKEKKELLNNKDQYDNDTFVREIEKIDVLLQELQQENGISNFYKYRTPNIFY